MASPRISVVLPVRDGERFLAAAVESVLEQTFRAFELVVVDDGSTDTTPDVLAGFTDPRLRVCRQPREGLVAALGRALAESHAPYVARMDADDVSEPTRFQRQLEVLERLPGTAMVATWVAVIDEQGRELRREVLPTGHEDLVRRLLLRNPFQHGSVMIRREALDAAGGYRADYGANEDYDLWRRIAQAWELGCVPEPLYRYRVHPSAVTQTDPDRVRHREALRDEIWRVYPTSSYGVRSTVRAGRRYRELDEGVFRDHVADQRALAREALRRGRPLLALGAAAASFALSRD